MRCVSLDFDCSHYILNQNQMQGKQRILHRQPYVRMPPNQDGAVWRAAALQELSVWKKREHRPVLFLGAVFSFRRCRGDPWTGPAGLPALP